MNKTWQFQEEFNQSNAEANSFIDKSIDRAATFRSSKTLQNDNNSNETDSKRHF